MIARKNFLTKWLPVILVFTLFFIFSIPTLAFNGNIGSSFDDATELGITGTDWENDGILVPAYDEYHYFFFAVDSTQTVTFKLHNPDAKVTMTLFASDRTTIVAESENMGLYNAIDQKISVSLSPGNYFLRTHMNVNNNYSYLTWDAAADSQAEAYLLPLCRQIDGYFDADRAGDWYACNWTAGQNFNIQLQGESGTDFDLFVYSGTTLVDYSNGISYPESVNITTNSEMTYFWIKRYHGEGEYRLTIDLVQEYDLSVSITGTGSGSVTSSPSGIDCSAAGGDCSETYPEDTIVTLTASADSGSSFSGWGGACSGTSSTCSVTMSQAKSVTASFTVDPVYYTLSVGVGGLGSGSVTSSPSGIDCSSTGGECSASFAEGTLVTLTASADSGSTFAGWTDDCTDTGTCQVTMNAARTVGASFSQNEINYSLSVSVSGTGSGGVTSSPSGIDCSAAGGDCSETYPEDTIVTLTASADSGSSFSGWGGACSGTSSTCMVTMSAAKSVSALFAESFTTYTLSVTVSGDGSGTVTSSPSGIDCSSSGGDCSASFAEGTLVTLTASADSGSSFAGWANSCSGTGTCQVTMDAARTVGASFSQNEINYSLSVSVSGTGSGTVTSSPSGIDCSSSGGDCSETYPEDTIVTLTASADGGSTFSGWGGACSGSSTTCMVTMSAAKSVSALFAESSTTYTLSVTVSGLGTGTVTSSPSGIDCSSSGGDCSASFAEGTLVTLTASADSDSTFAGWANSCSGTGTCQVTMDAARTAGASFNQEETDYNLSVSISGTGSGTVTSSPSGIDCSAAGGDCSETYPENAVVTLTASADGGSTFSGWGGACSGSSTTCTVTMSAAKIVTASFVEETASYLLAVNITGTGNGMVTSSPSGINCATSGGDCSQFYSSGTQVILTASSDSGSTFDGWSAAGCSGTGSCTVTVNAPQSITAIFGSDAESDSYEPDDDFAAAASIAAGAHQAHVISPVGDQDYVKFVLPYASGITLEAYRLVYQNDDDVDVYLYNASHTQIAYDDSSNGMGFPRLAYTCASPLPAGTYYAKFEEKGNNREIGDYYIDLEVNPCTSLYDLSINIEGTGSGSVTSSPSGISCSTGGGDCSEQYLESAQVTLTPSADYGSLFAGWEGGGCSGISTCTVTMNAAKLVVATFDDDISVDIYEPNNDFASAVELFEDIAQYHNIDPAREDDYIKFTISTDSAVTVGEMDTNTQVEAYLYNSSYQQINYKNDSGYAQFNYYCSNPLPAGTYYIRLTAPSATWRYKVGLQITSCDETYQLSVNKQGDGSENEYSVVRSQPEGIDCGEDCTASYAVGQTVKLYAAAQGANYFSGWSGACAGSLTPCTLTMNSNKTVVANYKKLIAPDVRFPKNGYRITAGITTLKWTLDPGASYYILELYRPNGDRMDRWTVTPAFCDDAFCNFKLHFNLNTEYGTYQWRVRSYFSNPNMGGDAIGSWSDSASFEYVQAMPFSQYTPYANQLLGDSTPTFTWQDCDDNVYKYVLEIWSASGALTQRVNLKRSSVCTDGTCSWTQTTPLTRGIYKWRVLGKKWPNLTSWTSSRLFFDTADAQTAAVLPDDLIAETMDIGRPYPGFPKNGYQVITGTTLFKWLPAAEAASYQLELYRPDGTRLDIWYLEDLACSTTCQFKLPYKLEQEYGTYFWRVRGYNSSSSGPWSIEAVFEYIPLDSLTRINNDELISFFGSTPVLTWNESDQGVYKYVIEIYTYEDSRLVVQAVVSPDEICSSGTCSWSPPASFDYGRYNWRVLGKKWPNVTLWTTTQLLFYFEAD